MRIQNFKPVVGVLLLLVLAVSCKNSERHQEAAEKENLEAKALLQGIWVNEDDEDVAFKAVGDSIYYPDSTSMPVRFMIVRDTLIMQGGNTVKYPIVKQAAHLFVFKNQNGESVRLVKSENPDDRYAFEDRPIQPVNQRQLIKRDTVVMSGGEKFHCYVQVNPTTYKVIKSSYTDEGVEVENVYYDNIIHLGVFHGANRLFSSNFYKKDFKRFVPESVLGQCVLSDFIFHKIDDAEGIIYHAVLGVPDSPSYYIVEVLVSFSGKISMKVVE